MPLEGDFFPRCSTRCPLNARGSRFESSSATKSCCIIMICASAMLTCSSAECWNQRMTWISRSCLRSSSMSSLGANNPWTRRRKVALKELVQEPWAMLPPDTYVGALIVEVFRASGLAVPPQYLAHYGIELQSALLGTGRFLSVLPGSFLRFSGKRFGISALPIELPVAPRPVGIVTLKNRTLGPLAQLFIDCARNLSKPLTGTSMTVRRRQSAK